LTLPRVDLVRSAVSQDTLRTVERGSTNALLVSYWGVALALEDPLGDLFDVSYGDLAGVLVGRDRAGGGSFGSTGQPRTGLPGCGRTSARRSSTFG